MLQPSVVQARHWQAFGAVISPGCSIVQARVQISLTTEAVWQALLQVVTVLSFVSSSSASSSLLAASPASSRAVQICLFLPWVHAEARSLSERCFFFCVAGRISADDRWCFSGWWMAHDRVKECTWYVRLGEERVLPNGSWASWLAPGER